jgi:glycosyltransferase involved in cell wall biosynthesis
MAVGYTTAVAHKSRLKNRTIRVVPNGIEIPQPISPVHKAALRKEMIGDQTRTIIMTVGRLVEEKGYPHLIRAFSLLRKNHPETALVFVGSGALENKLRAQVELAGLAKHVTFLGTRRDVPDLLASSDLYVNSSIWEGLPYTVLEGMAAGLPVVATDVGDNARVVINGTGLVIPSEQPQLLCEALSTLLDQPDLIKRFGSAAKAHVTQNHSLNTWCETLLDLYSSVLPRSRYTPI